MNGRVKNQVVLSNAVFLPEVVRMLNDGHTVTINLKGYSMRPFLENERDKALLTKAVNPKVGDPVLAEVGPGVFVASQDNSYRRRKCHSSWRRQSRL